MTWPYRRTALESGTPIGPRQIITSLVGVINYTAMCVYVCVCLCVCLCVLLFVVVVACCLLVAAVVVVVAAAVID